MGGPEDESFSRFRDEDGIRPIDAPGPSGPGDDRKRGEETPPPGFQDASGAAPEKSEEEKRKEELVQDELRNLVRPGEYADLLRKDPTLKRLTVGAGWDQRAIEDDDLDVDLSVFLLDKTGQTRVDEDFVFYNNTSGCDGAVRHLGDSRTGAGDGDDESILLDLHGIPFDVLRIAIGLTIYDEDFKGRNFSQIRNAYVRFVNRDDGLELVRMELDEQILGENNAIYIGVLIREGPKWIFEALGKGSQTGLAVMARDFGLVIRELQSTALTGTDDEVRAKAQQDFA